MSDVKYGGFSNNFTASDRHRFFDAVSFSETPIAQVHCLLDIAYRHVNLEPYGLAFLKDNLVKKHVAPVVYLSNHGGAIDPVAKALFQLANTAPSAAELLLPLVSVFGDKLTPPSWSVPPPGNVDWRWEREWRLPASKAPLSFSDADVFVGFCPDSEIPHFEAVFPGVGFIDPLRTMSWYAKTLISQRQRLNMKHSVV